MSAMLSAAADAGNWVMGSTTATTVFTGLIVVAWLVALPVTWLKGRSEWLFWGLILTAGLAWIVAAFLPAAPGSQWASLRPGRDAAG